MKLLTGIFGAIAALGVYIAFRSTKEKYNILSIESKTIEVVIQLQLGLL